MSTDFSPGLPFPDIELDDHAGNRRALSELAGGDPVVLQFVRGWWCPKEQAFFRRLIALQDETEVAYSRIVSVSVDPPAVSAAFRAGLGARWTFLSDPARSVQAELRLRETSTTATTVWLRGRPFQWPAPAARYGRARARSPGRPGLLAARQGLHLLRAHDRAHQRAAEWRGSAAGRAWRHVQRRVLDRGRLAALHILDVASAEKGGQ